MQKHLASILFVFVALAGVCIPNARASEQAKAPTIAVEKDEASIGECIAGTLAKVAYTIRNTGDAELIVTNVGASCGCLAPERSWPERLGPGASGTIQLGIDTWAFSGRLKEPLTVFSNDAKQPRLTVWLTGQVEKVLDMKPAMIQFGLIDKDKASEARVALITNVTQQGLKLAGVRSNDKRFTPTLSEVEIGKRWELTVRAVPPFAFGANAATITLLTDHPKAKSFELSAFLYCPPPLQVIPPRIILPAEKFQKPMNRELFLRARPGDGWRLDGFACSDGGVQISTRPGRTKEELPRVLLVFPEGYRVSVDTACEVVLKLKQNEKPDAQVTLRVPIQAAGQTAENLRK